MVGVVVDVVAAELSSPLLVIGGRATAGPDVFFVL